MNNFDIARLYSATVGDVRRVHLSMPLIEAFSTYKSFMYKHVDIPNKSNIAFNNLCNVFKFHVPSYITKDNIINDILCPMAFFLNRFDLDITNVKKVDFYILTNEASSLLLDNKSMGIQGRIAPHEYIIAIRNSQKAVETILHELMHIIDDEIDHYLLRMHHKLLDFSNRYFEIKAFSYSMIAYTVLKFTQDIPNAEIHELQQRIMMYRFKLKVGRSEFIRFYEDAPEFNHKSLYTHTLSTFDTCISRLTDFVQCF